MVREIDLNDLYDLFQFTYYDLYEYILNNREKLAILRQGIDLREKKLGIVVFPTDCGEPRCMCEYENIPEEIGEAICSAWKKIDHENYDEDDFLRELEEIEKRYNVVLVVLYEYDRAILVFY